MSLTVDRKEFFEMYGEAFGPSPQPTIDGLNYFLNRFETETRLDTIPQYAYVLATAYHESGKKRDVNGKKVLVRFQPVKESRERSDSPRRANQDRYWKTGFYGRGYPQTTWERNYLKSGQALGLGDLFVKNPDLLLEPKYAYDAMIICMVRGIYTGKKLSDFIDTSEHDYFNARRVINGTDRAALIATYAEKFEGILDDAQITADTLEIPATEPPTDEPKPSVWDKMTGWTEKATKVNSLRDAAAPISASSAKVFTSTRLLGFLSMIAGLFLDHWLLIAGVALFIIAIWYLKHAKDRADARGPEC